MTPEPAARIVSVVVPVYNQAAMLAVCLTALRAQTLDLEQYEIVVVDDGSTDDVPTVVRRFQQGPPRVRYIAFPANRGRSAARNAGILAAAAALIVFLDSDVIVGRDFLDQHLQVHASSGPRALSRGPVVVVPSPTLVGRVTSLRIAASPAFLDTANAGIGKAELLEAGLFDEGFPGYGWEDFDLGQRLSRIGVRRVFCPGAVAWHVQAPPRPELVAVYLQKEAERARSAAYFLRKNPTRETRWLIQWTPVHRAVYWLASWGGKLSAERAAGLARRLRAAGLESAAYVLMRAALNRHYLEVLRQELRTDAVLV